MKITNVNFKEVNLPLNSECIEMLGKQYAQTDNDKPMFVIKTTHPEEKIVLDSNERSGFITKVYIEEQIQVLNVFKISNGWVGTIDGHFIYDYRDYTITHITKLEF